MKKYVERKLPDIAVINFEKPKPVITKETLVNQYKYNNTIQTIPDNVKNTIDMPIVNHPIKSDRRRTIWLSLCSGLIGALVVCLITFPIFYWVIDSKEIELKGGTTTIINYTNIENTTIEETVSNTISQAVITVLVSDFWGLSGSGSGVVYHIGAKGEVYILTNAHVIEKTNKVTIFRNDLGEGAAEIAEIIAKDVEADIAVLKIAAPKNLYPVIMEIADSSNVKIGQKVLAIGSPLGPVFSGSVTAGIISGTNRAVPTDDKGGTQNYIQTDAAVNGGNSGGALVNMQGQLIGIISAKVIESENMGLAIPSNDVLKTLKELGVPLPEHA